jgi:gamma-glutamylcyclotransferase (GGCT)/AIG2-like uncharacterized protein YtfP
MYIFGYGSLINSASRMLTGHTGEAIPAVVKGFVRHWSKIDDSYVLSPLAVNQGEGSVNGVLLEVDDSALAEFDRREAGYIRVPVSRGSIEPLAPYDNNQPVWMYVVDKTVAPCHNSPIVQSYVDTVLAGCLEISEAFADMFIEQTLGWHHPHENDRDQPRYQRVAGVSNTHHTIINALLKERFSYAL